MKLTPLYPPNIKPVRSGVYQTQLTPDAKAAYSHWNNGTKHWGWGETNPSLTETYPQGSSAYQNKYWRGLTKETK